MRQIPVPFNAGHGSVFNAGFNKPLAAARISRSIPLRRHKLVCAGARVFNQVAQSSEDPAVAEFAFLSAVTYRAGAAVCTLYRCAICKYARFKNKSAAASDRGVRAALVNYSHHARKAPIFLMLSPNPARLISLKHLGAGGCAAARIPSAAGGNSRFAVEHLGGLS